MRIKFVLKSEHVLASKGARRPTPTQSTCLYYCDVMKLVSVVIQDLNALQVNILLFRR